MFLSQTDDEVGLAKRFGLLAATVRRRPTCLSENAVGSCCPDDPARRPAEGLDCRLLIERTGLKVHVVHSPILPDSADTPMFWNASTWEGQDVKVVKIYL
jgi:hypothetical protein